MQLQYARDRMEEKENKIYPAIPGEKELYILSDFFKVLGDPTRMKILLQIAAAEIRVRDIANCLRISESAVSHHLQVLKMNRFVKWRREGKCIFYRLSDKHVETIIAQAQKHMAEK